ncbi:PREDICTED: protein TIFY 8-like [Nelumbo nucifera]|uniref:Protein TIFY n=1 Tax=Nelumbo nucifera TaxID=4432 RepID=A0A1U7ZQN4_NELNU|nr:PREDICTED: protein TIFY 8-like [Nelumbo nucifera]
MAVLMMANNNISCSKNNSSNSKEEKPIFHDFLGMSCASDSPPPIAVKSVGFGGESRPSEASASASVSVGASSGGHGPVSATSDLGSERQVGNHFEGVPFYGSRSDFSAAEINNRFPGRKRSNSDSMFMGSTKDRMPQLGQDSLEGSHFLKIFRNGAGGEKPRRSHDEDLFFGMQPPRPSSNSPVLLHQPICNRPDSVGSKWERSMMMSVGPVIQYPPPMGQYASFVDKVSSNRYREANAGPSLISQPAADEGSRTGIKGTGILSAINANSGTTERNSSGVSLSCNRLNSGPQTADPESSNPPSRHGLTSTSRQMTIFYAGQAHVFDDVHPNKADVIMALAGSNGGSWSTTYSPKSSVRPCLNEAHFPNEETGIGKSNMGFQQELRGRLPIPGSSSHGINQGGRISTIQVDPRILSSGAHQGGTIVKETSSLAQAAEVDTKGKREVGS